MSEKKVQQEFLIKHQNRQKYLRDNYGVQTFVHQKNMSNDEKGLLDTVSNFFYSTVNIVATNTVISNGKGKASVDFEVDYNYDIPAVIVFPFSMGINSVNPVETGYFNLKINEEIDIPFSLTKHNKRWEANGCKFLFHVEKVLTSYLGQTIKLDPAMLESSIVSLGLAAVLVPKNIFARDKILKISIKGISSIKSKTWCRIGKPKDGLAFMNVEEIIKEIVANNMIRTIGNKKYLFGDIHVHSGESDFLGWGCGEKKRVENFDFARNIAGLDFFCLSEHDWQMDNNDWEHLQSLTESYNERDKFVTLHGYEWTSPNYGHRNVYFLDKGGILFRSSRKMVGYGEWQKDNPTPDELWQTLKNGNVDFFTVPHHPSTSQFPVSTENYYNENFDRLIEIYSCWGFSESSYDLQEKFNTGVSRTEYNTVRDHLNNGRKYGIICSSDAHDGHPGLSQGTEKRSQLYHYLGSGRVAVVVDKFDRNSIFYALKNRKAYGTTGEPILLEYRLGDAEMGETIEELQYSKLPVNLNIVGTTPLRNIEVVSNEGVVFKANLDGINRDRNFKLVKDIVVKNKSYYYIRVEQDDGERAWSSPIWID